MKLLLRPGVTTGARRPSEPGWLIHGKRPRRLDAAPKRRDVELRWRKRRLAELFP
jgi:hypothetical protein